VNIPQEKKKIHSNLRNGLLHTEEPNSLESTITRSLLESPKKLAFKLNAQIVAVTWRLVGRREEGETHYLFSRSCRGRDMVFSFLNPDG